MHKKKLSEKSKKEIPGSKNAENSKSSGSNNRIAEWGLSEKILNAKNIKE